MKPLKWRGVLFALFLLFLYIMGTYDFFMMLSHNESYYFSKGFCEGVHQYFTDYPIPGLILWVGNRFDGSRPIFVESEACLPSRVCLIPI